MEQMPYTTLSSFLRKRFGCRVHKITIDAGFTCPNRDGTAGTGGCIYCNERGSGTGKSKTASITEQILSAKEYLGLRYGAEKFIAYFQSFSNTYAPVERLSVLYEEALAVDGIVGLAVGTRPDCASDDALDLLAELNRRAYVSIEYGLQSVHDRTLSLINRGHTFASFRDAVERTRRRGLDITVHVIIGLPGEAKEDMLETARVLGSMDIQGLKLHLLYVVRGTRLHEMLENGEYRCLNQDEYADIVADFLTLIPRDVVIHRLTGDPHRDELIAPAWALEKDTNLNLIRRTMNDRGIVQGCRVSGR